MKRWCPPSLHRSAWTKPEFRVWSIMITILMTFVIALIARVVTVIILMMNINTAGIMNMCYHHFGSSTSRIASYR